MAMTLAQVDAAILTQHINKQTQLEARYNAANQTERKNAKQPIANPARVR